MFDSIKMCTADREIHTYEAEKLEAQVMKTYKAQYGPDHRLTLTMNNLAATYIIQERLVEAEQLYMLWQLAEQDSNG